MTASYQQKMDPVADLLGGGRVVAYKVVIAHAVGSVTAGVWLSQLWFWTNHWSSSNHQNPDRWDGEWLTWTQDEITAQTALTRRESDTARRILRDLGIIEEERRGLPARVWYRLDKTRLYALLTEYAAQFGGKRQSESNAADSDGGNGQSSMAESANLDDEPCQTSMADSANPIYKAADAENIREEIKMRTTTDEPPAVVVEDVKNTSHNSPVVEQLVNQRISPDAAQQLVATYGEERCQRQLDRLLYRRADNRTAILRRSIEGDWSPDESQCRAEESARQDQKRREKQAVVSEAMRVQAEAQRAENMRLEAIWDSLTSEERTQVEEMAWARAIRESPAPIRSRLEHAAKSQEPPSDMARAFIERSRAKVLEEWTTAECHQTSTPCSFSVSHQERR